MITSPMWCVSIQICIYVSASIRTEEIVSIILLLSIQILQVTLPTTSYITSYNHTIGTVACNLVINNTLVCDDPLVI